MSFFETIDYKAGDSLAEYYDSYPNTFIFLTSWVQYQSLCLVFNMGEQFKKPYYTNYWFTGFFFILKGVTLYTVMSNELWVRKLLGVIFS